MSTQSKCQIALKFSSTGTDLKKWVLSCRRVWSWRRRWTGKRDRKDDRELDGKPNPHRHKKDVFKIFGAVSIFEQRGPWQGGNMRCRPEINVYEHISCLLLLVLFCSIEIVVYYLNHIHKLSRLHTCSFLSANLLCAEHMEQYAIDPVNAFMTPFSALIWSPKLSSPKNIFPDWYVFNNQYWQIPKFVFLTDMFATSPQIFLLVV